MSLDDRFFFHTFPRPRPSESAEATRDRAVNILSFMKEAGLVLAPEIVKWKLPLQGGGVEHLAILQRRACFTELSVGELDRHATTFGPISLSFNIRQVKSRRPYPGHLRSTGGGDRITQPDEYFLR